jgi:hypothetical protein
MLVTIFIIAFVLHFIRGRFTEHYSTYFNSCNSCTLTPNRLPPLSSKSMLLPYPRYEFSYAPDYLKRKQLEIIDSQISPSDICKGSKSVSVPSLCELNTNFSIIPDKQYYYVKNRMGGVTRPVYSKIPIGIPTDGSIQHIDITHSM